MIKSDLDLSETNGFDLENYHLNPSTAPTISKKRVDEKEPPDLKKLTKSEILEKSTRPQKTSHLDHKNPTHILKNHQNPNFLSPLPFI